MSVTVVDTKTGRPILGLGKGDFTFFEDKAERPVIAAEFSTEPIDAMLLLDSSLAGEMVRPVADELVGYLQPKEQMAIVSFHSSADLVQDFTSSKELLGRALNAVRYGNQPRLLNALFAAMDTGFKSAIYRRVVLLLTAGVEGDSRVTERDIVRLARRNGVSIYPVYVIGYERSMLEKLARQTGGATFNLRNMRKAEAKGIGARIFEIVRGHYTLTLPGNLALGEKIRVEVKRPGKIFASVLPLD